MFPCFEYFDFLHSQPSLNKAEILVRKSLIYPYLWNEIHYSQSQNLSNSFWFFENLGKIYNLSPRTHLETQNLNTVEASNQSAFNEVLNLSDKLKDTIMEKKMASSEVVLRNRFIGLVRSNDPDIIFLTRKI